MPCDGTVSPSLEPIQLDNHKDLTLLTGGSLDLARRLRRVCAVLPAPAERDRHRARRDSCRGNPCGRLLRRGQHDAGRRGGPRRTGRRPRSPRERTQPALRHRHPAVSGQDQCRGDPCGARPRPGGDGRRHGRRGAVRCRRSAPGERQRRGHPGGARGRTDGTARKRRRTRRGRRGGGLPLQRPARTPPARRGDRPCLGDRRDPRPPSHTGLPGLHDVGGALHRAGLHPAGRCRVRRRAGAGGAAGGTARPPRRRRTAPARPAVRGRPAVRPYREGRGRERGRPRQSRRQPGHRAAGPAARRRARPRRAGADDRPGRHR